MAKTPGHPPPDPSADWLTGAEAAVFSRLCAKSLQRADARGEELGLRRFGRRVLFHKATLQAWMFAQTTVTPAAAPVPNLRLAHPAR